MAVKRFYFFGSYSSAPTFRPFIMKVNSGADGIVKIPTTTSFVYNYDVKTSDGQTFTAQTGDLSITFPLSNTFYTIEVSGIFPKFQGNILTSTEKDKYDDILQWGDVLWESVANSFQSFNNLKCTATDVPDFTALTTFNGTSIFFDSPLINISTLSLWDMSKFTSLNAFLYNTSQLYAIDWTSGTTGTIACTNIQNITRGTPIKSFKADCRAVTTIGNATFACPDLEVLILNLMPVSFNISVAPKVLGSKIDDLFTSLGTANTGATITISTAQNTSGIDTTIATSKGWTIIVV